MIILRYNGEIKEFSCRMIVSLDEDKYEYKDINSGTIDKYVRGTHIEFKLSDFKKFMTISDVQWLKTFMKNGGEIKYESEESGAIVARWISVKSYNLNLDETFNYNTKLETDLFQLRSITTITLKSIRYVENGIVADIIPIAESEF